MEQENQQPNQQLTHTSLDEVKKQKSKRIKIALLALAAVVFAVGGVTVWLGAYSDLFDTRGTIEGRLYGCVTSEECILVKDGWCGTVVAINRDKETEWRIKNTEQTESHRQEQISCPPTVQEALDVANFQAMCQELRCQAVARDVSIQDFTSSEVEGWQTYRNDEFGFEVRYPGDWVDTIIEGNPNPYIFCDAKEGVNDNGTPFVFLGPVIFTLEEAEGLSVKEYVDKLERETQSFFPDLGLRENNYRREKITIDGVEGERLIFAFLPANKIWIGDGGQILSISYDGGSRCSTKEIEASVEDKGSLYLAEKILATFRFVPPAP